MRLWRVPLRHEGALGIGRVVVSIFSRDAKSASYAVDGIG